MSRFGPQKRRHPIRAPSGARTSLAPSSVSTLKNACRDPDGCANIHWRTARSRVVASPSSTSEPTFPNAYASAKHPTTSASSSHCSRRLPSAPQSLSNRALKILLAAESSVDHLARPIEHDNVGRGRCIIRAARVSLAIEYLRPRKLMFRDVRFHALGGLIHRDG